MRLVITTRMRNMKKQIQNIRPEVFDGIKGGYGTKVLAPVGLFLAAIIGIVVPERPFELEWVQFWFFLGRCVGHCVFFSGRGLQRIDVTGLVVLRQRSGDVDVYE